MSKSIVISLRYKTEMLTIFPRIPWRWHKSFLILVITVSDILIPEGNINFGPEASCSKWASFVFSPKPTEYICTPLSFRPWTFPCTSSSNWPLFSTINTLLCLSLSSNKKWLQKSSAVLVLPPPPPGKLNGN